MPSSVVAGTGSRRQGAGDVGDACASFMSFFFLFSSQKVSCILSRDRTSFALATIGGWKGAGERERKSGTQVNRAQEIARLLSERNLRSKCTSVLLVSGEREEGACVSVGDTLYDSANPVTGKTKRREAARSHQS